MLINSMTGKLTIYKQKFNNNLIFSLIAGFFQDSTKYLIACMHIDTYSSINLSSSGNIYISLFKLLRKNDS